jgi:transcriptional regulator with XRE-family HTH domain
MMNLQQATGTRSVFAKRLKELRVPRGFKTARKLAQTLGIDENRYTRYERAEVEPDLGLLMKICEVLGVTPNDLLGVSRGELSTGFREDAPATFKAQTSSDCSSEQRRRALAWQLAEEIVSIEMNSTSDAARLGGLAAVQKVSATFTALEQDPFSAIAGLASHRPVANAPAQRQEKLATLIGQLIAEVNRSALS